MTSQVSSRYSLLGHLFLVALMVSGNASAQSLQEQYIHFLDNGCANMNFQRDGANMLTPGQAGTNLQRLCNAPAVAPSTGGDTFTDWFDPLQWMGARTTTTALDLPDWQNRTIRGAARNRNRDAHSSDSKGRFVGLFSWGGQSNSGIDNGSNGDTSATYPMSVSLGGGYWFTDSLLASISVGYSGLHDLNPSFDGRPVPNTYGNGMGLSVSIAWQSNDGMWLGSVLEYSRKVVNPVRYVNLYFDQLSPAPSGGSDDSTADSRYVGGSARGSNQFAEVLGGYHFQWRRLSVNPRLGVTYRKTQMGSLTESAIEDSYYLHSLPVSPMALTFAADQETSLASLVAVEVLWHSNARRMRVNPMMEVSWTHEVNNTQRNIAASFSEDLRATPTQFSFVTPARSTDAVKIDLGFSAEFARRFTFDLLGSYVIDGPLGNAVGVRFGVRANF